MVPAMSSGSRQAARYFSSVRHLDRPFPRDARIGTLAHIGDVLPLVLRNLTRSAKEAA